MTTVPTSVLAGLWCSFPLVLLFRLLSAYLRHKRQVAIKNRQRTRRLPTFSVQEDSVAVGQMIQFLGRRMRWRTSPPAYLRAIDRWKERSKLKSLLLQFFE
jgi:hypothetical protein